MQIKVSFYFCIMSKDKRFLARNTQVRKFFTEMERKHPEWRMSALEKATADHFFITERTVRAIIKCSGIYSTNQ